MVMMSMMPSTKIVKFIVHGPGGQALVRGQYSHSKNILKFLKKILLIDLHSYFRKNK